MKKAALNLPNEEDKYAAGQKIEEAKSMYKFFLGLYVGDKTLH